MSTPRCTEKVPARHEATITEVIIAPETSLEFVRTTCKGCRQWVKDQPLLNRKTGEWRRATSH